MAWFGHAGGRRADGLSMYSSKTVAALQERGATVSFFSHRLDGDVTPVDEPVQLRAVRFKTVTLSLPGSADRIASELDRFHPDVVHVSLSFSLIDGTVGKLARRRGIPVVATIHLPSAAAGSGRDRVLRGLYRFHARYLADYDRCVALSDGQRELLVESGVDAERITVVHNGIDTDAFTPGPSSMRDELGAAFVVAYLGRIDPEKRVLQLVRSFLKLDWPDDHLLLVAGAGTHERKIRRLSNRFPQVRFLGRIDDDQRLDLLRAADVFVLPSTAEGLSASLLEAMAAGAPVLATDVGDHGIALADAGVLVPVYPLEPGLSDALRRLRDDPVLRTQLGGRARERVVSAYALQTNVDRLLALYAELIGTESAAA